MLEEGISHERVSSRNCGIPEHDRYSKGTGRGGILRRKQYNPSLISQARRRFHYSRPRLFNCDM